MPNEDATTSSPRVSLQTSLRSNVSDGHASEETEGSRETGESVYNSEAAEAAEAAETKDEPFVTPCDVMDVFYSEEAAREGLSNRCYTSNPSEIVLEKGQVTTYECRWMYVGRKSCILSLAKADMSGL
jgi:hypothetical protein